MYKHILYKHILIFKDIGGNIQLPDDSFDGDNIHRFDENAPGKLSNLEEKESIHLS